MLALVEVPDYVQKMYATYKKLTQEVYSFVKDSGENERVKNEQDLLRLKEEFSVIYITEGFFKLFHKGNVVRLYSESDFIISGSESEPDSMLSSDFTGGVTVFEKNAFFDKIKSDNEILETWVTLTDLENKINRTLAGTYIQQTVSPDFSLKEFKEDDLIILEGDKSTDIFELISGSAKAYQKDNEVGSINEGEIFGEVSFFTGELRTATVKASQKCMVRVINEVNFADMIRHNPNFAISVSKTLARSVANVTQRLSGNGG